MKNKAQYLVTSTPITSGASMKEEILHMMGVLSHSCWVLQCWQWSVRKKTIFPEIRSTGTESKKIDFLLSQNSLQYIYTSISSQPPFRQHRGVLPVCDVIDAWIDDRQFLYSKYVSGALPLDRYFDMINSKCVSGTTVYI